MRSPEEIRTRIAQLEKQIEAVPHGSRKVLRERYYELKWTLNETPKPVIGASKILNNYESKATANQKTAN